MDLLCLDDFGVQYAGEWGASRFDALMEERYCKCRAVCVTTNSTLKDLRAMPQWSRVVDRWSEMCVGLETQAGSQRGRRR
jgi:DNA replication protein DnaC